MASDSESSRSSLQAAIEKKRASQEYKFNSFIVEVVAQLYRGNLSEDDIDDKSRKYSNDEKLIINNILPLIPKGLVKAIDCYDIERSIWGLLDTKQVSDCYSAMELRMAVMLYITGESATRAEAVKEFKINISTFDRRFKELLDFFQLTTISQVKELYVADPDSVKRAVNNLFAERIGKGKEPFIRTDPINILSVKNDEKDKAAFGLGFMELGIVLKKMVSTEGEWELPRAQERVEQAKHSLVVAQMALLGIHNAREDKVQQRVVKSCKRVLQKAQRDVFAAEGKISVRAPRTFVKKSIARQTVADKIAWRKKSPLSRARIEGADPVVFAKFITDVQDYIFEKIDDGTIPQIPTAAQFCC
jgi:hypothetical protein